MSFLRKITDIGARDRYRPYHDKARAQVARELDLIEKLELAGYFLIVWDIVNFCRQQDILVQGRGSAANSAVCYSLGITAVDPVGMELLFERFLSEERGEWPDIDHRSAERRSARARDPARLREIRQARRRDDRQRHHLSRPQRRARSGQGARASIRRSIDRLAKVMNQFEFIDPADTIGRNMAAAGLDAGDRRVQHFARALVPDAGPAAPSRPAFRRHGDLPGRPVVGRTARERQHARIAWSCSGTRTTAPTWGSSRSICSASA